MIILEIGKNNNLLLQLKVSCFQSSDEGSCFTEKNYNTTHITISNYVETRTIAQYMVTTKQMILYTNALPQPPLIQTKYT